MNRGSLKLTITDAAHSQLLAVTLPFNNNVVNIKVESMDLDGDSVTKEVSVPIRDEKHSVFAIDSHRVSHTQLGQQIAQRFTRTEPTSNIFCAPLWKEIIGGEIEKHYPCYARNLWQVFIINYQILTKKIDETIAMINTVGNSLPCIKFIRAHWPSLQSMFAEDPVLWLGRLRPSVFASYMHVVAKYYQAKCVSSEIALQFVRHTPIFLAIHRRKLPSKIFAACLKADCKCHTCDAIRALPDVELPAKKPANDEQLPVVYNMDVFGTPQQNADNGRVAGSLQQLLGPLMLASLMNRNG
jgi:hypothetical protein